MQVLIEAHNPSARSGSEIARTIAEVEELPVPGQPFVLCGYGIPKDVLAEEVVPENGPKMPIVIIHVTAKHQEHMIERHRWTKARPS